MLRVCGPVIVVQMGVEPPSAAIVSSQVQAHSAAHRPRKSCRQRRIGGPLSDAGSEVRAV